MRVGVIGCGFVGGAVAQGFSLCCDVKIYDKFKAGYDSLEEVLQQEIIFLCLPTPMMKNGDANLSSIYDMATQIRDKKRKTLVIKSTVPPGTTRKLSSIFPSHDWVMNPEFLTARAARLEFINASRIVIGGLVQPAAKVAGLYRMRFPATPIYQVSWEAAEMLKYMANCFFALKISYLNEIYDAATKAEVPYSLLRDMFVADGRIGNSHLDVPGHDGDRGFGGTCFPKDVAAFVNWGRSNNIPFLTLEAAQKINDRVRTKKDWEVT